MDGCWSWLVVVGWWPDKVACLEMWFSRASACICAKFGAISGPRLRWRAAGTAPASWDHCSLLRSSTWFQKRWLGGSPRGWLLSEGAGQSVPRGCHAGRNLPGMRLCNTICVGNKQPMKYRKKIPCLEGGVAASHNKKQQPIQLQLPCESLSHRGSSFSMGERGGMETHPKPQSLRRTGRQGSWMELVSYHATKFTALNVM